MVYVDLARACTGFASDGLYKGYVEAKQSSHKRQGSTKSGRKRMMPSGLTSSANIILGAEYPSPKIVNLSNYSRVI